MKTINKIRNNNFPVRETQDEEGELLITKINRILDENEPLTDGAPLIYTPKNRGVIPEYNIRTDKWEIAMKAMDRVSEYKLSEYMKKTEGPDTPETEENANGVGREENPKNTNEGTAA